VDGVKDIALILACLALMAGIAAVAYASIAGRRT
jgi:hypothetical protein